jgi:hypothetical protein
MSPERPAEPGQSLDSRVARGSVTVVNEFTGDVEGVATIMLADDHRIVRSGLRMLLDAEAGARGGRGGGRS